MNRDFDAFQVVGKKCLCWRCHSVVDLQLFLITEAPVTTQSKCSPTWFGVSNNVV